MVSHKLKNIPAVGYIRVSTEEQANSGAGLKAQRAAILAEAERRGWRVVQVIEDAVAISNECYITDSNSHGMEGRDVYEAPVRIGRGSWVGALYSSRLSQVPQSGHLPIHLGCTLPQ